MKRSDPEDPLLPAERKIVEQLGHLALDFNAMWMVSNLFRASTAVRRKMETELLAGDRLSWTAFTVLWVLWVWGEMESRELAAATGVSRPTTTGVVSTLTRRRLVRRSRVAKDGRLVRVSLTPSGRRLIQELFPRFNAKEREVAAVLPGPEQERLAAMLRMLVRATSPSG
jgi:MarR family transcriptional regulator, organic hydroperoxide resistance regulator